MRLHWFAMSGLTRFDRAVEIDFDVMRSGIVAVTGPNGAGKTTCMEATCPVVLFREMPTRQPSTLSASTRPEGARVLLDFSLGEGRYLADLSVDRHGIQTAKLSRDDEPLVSGKVRDYDAWIAKHIGPKSAVYASAYGMQGGGGRFDALAVRDRKEIFRYYLGLDVIAAMHGVSKARWDSIRATLTRREETRRALEAVEAEIPVKETDARRANEQREVLAAEVLRLKEEYETAVEQDASMRLIINQIAQRDTLRSRIFDLREKVAAARRREGAVEVPPELPEPGELKQLAEDVRTLRDARQRVEIETVKAEAEAKRRLEALEQARRDIQRAMEVPCSREPKLTSTCKYLSDARQAELAVAGLQKASGEAHSRHNLLRARRVEIEGGLKVALAGGDPVEQYANYERSRVARETALRERANAARELADMERLLAADTEAWQKLPEDLPGRAPLGTDVEVVRQKLRVAEGRLIAVERTATAIETTLNALCERAILCRKAVEEMEVRALEADSWELLARALGPNGVQAYEIDAAGPRVSELVNDLLEACYGPRFSIQIVTQREMKSKEGIEEDFAVRVHDAERGSSVDVGSLSGGERVIVDEALGTGLALFRNERLAQPFRTMWRDEPSAALDSDNQARYLQMMERARVLGGFHHVLLATHSEGVARGAAAEIHVGLDGVLTIAR